MSTLEADQIAAVMTTAENYHASRDWDNLYGVLHPLTDGESITGADLGRVYYYLGEACLGQNAVDAAMSYYEGAVPLATGEWADKNNDRIAEMRRYDAAVDAGIDGIEGSDEAAKALATAADALGRGDYDLARQWYDYAWDGIQLTEAQIGAAALGLASCCMQSGDYEQAEGYLQVAEQHDSSLATAVGERRDVLRTLVAGRGLGDDGVAVSELDELHLAAVNAAKSGDYHTAKTYFEQMLGAGVLAATERGRVQRNLGVVHLFLHDYDAARVSLQEAADVGTPDTRNTAQTLLDRLDRHEEAWDIAVDVDMNAD